MPRPPYQRPPRAHEEDCHDYRPGPAEWITVFRRLHTIFPNARLGFAEVGTYPQDPPQYKLAYLNRYYRLRIPLPYFTGGYFWWYYAEDMIPCRYHPLWLALAVDMR